MQGKTQNTKRIFVCEFRQETNSFNPIINGLEEFQRGGIFEGKEMIAALSEMHCAMHGMFCAVSETGGEVLPGYSMVSQSGGKVDHKVFRHFIEKTLKILRESMPVDGLLVSLHGATQTTEEDDACGVLLETLRKEAGEQVVIAVSCDLHANVTEKFTDNADYICGYQTYPHEDFYETGYRAATLLMRRLIDNRFPCMVCTTVPMVVPASGYSTLAGPFAELINYAKTLVHDGVLIDFSVFQMQPWLDVPMGGSAVLTIADDYQISSHYAKELAEKLFAMRDIMQPRLWSIDEIVAIAKKNKTGKPVILVDSSDSTNAGAVGDSAAVIHWLLDIGSPVKTAITVDDADTVLRAQQVGVGSVGRFSIGAGKDPSNAEPVITDAYVRSLHDGRFKMEGPAGRGFLVDIGAAAVLSIGNIDVLVCHKTGGNGDLQLYRHFGIEPTFYQMVVVKACTSYRAAYEPIAAAIYLADTPGAASPNLKSFTFQKLPKHFYPFSHLDGYQIQMPICIRPHL